MTDPVALCAEGEAAWHAVGYAGLGATWLDDGQLARAVDRVPHPLLLGAVSVSRDARPVADVPGVWCDSFANWGVQHGREPVPTGRWMVADPTDLVLPSIPSGVTVRAVEAVEDVTWFETIAFLAADGQPPSRPGELHPPTSLRLPGLTMFIAEADGAGVGTSLSVRTARVNNIGAVTVMPAYRGRGIGAALTAAACRAAPALPAVLSATDLGAGVYRRLGFTEVGRPLHHHPA